MNKELKIIIKNLQFFFSKKSFQNDSYQYSSSQTKPINKLIPSSN